MNVSFLSDGAIALCGCRVDAELAHELARRNLCVVTWSPTIKALLIGDEDERSKAKFRAALAAGIPIVPLKELRPVGEFDDLVIPSLVDTEARPAHRTHPTPRLPRAALSPPPPRPTATQPRRAAGDQLWTEKYRPRTLRDIVGNTEAIGALRTWLSRWSSGAALVTGPPGIGKTTAVHLVLAAAGYEVLEMNASDERSATAIRRTLTEGMLQSSGFPTAAAKPRALVLDEVDGMSSGDRGGIGELARIIRSKPKFPIICIANERTPRLRPLTNVCADFRFQRPMKSTITRALMGSVVAKEGLKISAAELETLCERNGNDLRSLLNFLQFGSTSVVGGAKDDLQRLDAFSATGRLFSSTGSVDDKMNLVFVDHGMVPLMVAEGYVAAAERGRGGLERIVSAADRLGDWDLLDRKIHRTQAWGLLPAATVAVAGAAAAVKGPAPFEIFPAWLGKASKRTKHRRLVGDLVARAAPGTPRAQADVCDVVEFLRKKTDALLTGTDVSVAVTALLEAQMTRDDVFETLNDVTFVEPTTTLDTKKKAAFTREWNKRVGKPGAGGDKEDETDSVDYVSDVESMDVDLD